MVNHLTPRLECASVSHLFLSAWESGDRWMQEWLNEWGGGWMYVSKWVDDCVHAFLCAVLCSVQDVSYTLGAGVDGWMRRWVNPSLQMGGWLSGCIFMRNSVFSLKCYLHTWESPYEVKPISQEFPQHCSGNTSNFYVINVPFLILSMKIIKHFFPGLSSPGHQWFNVLGFVCAGSISRS